MAPHPIDTKANELHYSKRDFKIPTKQHLLKIKKLMNLDLSYQQNAFIYMKGKEEETRDNTDIELEFRQESNFFYLTGVDEPGFHVLFDLKKERVYLVPPSLPEDDDYWKGPNHHSLEELKSRYDLDDLIPEPDLPNFLTDQLLFILDHQRHLIPTLSQIDTCRLKQALDESRLIKFPWEIDIIRRSMAGSSRAHRRLMESARPGMPEARLAADFKYFCSREDLYRQAYLPIVASGPRTATLHYSKNNQAVPDGPHTMVLVDAGAEHLCYGSDITRTFPISGRFSIEAKTIYNIVLKMQLSVLSVIKPGVYWTDMENLSREILCEELMKIGILIGDKDELLEKDATSAFYYHGLGHSLGLDVHDVGGKDEDVEMSKKDECNRSGFLINRPIEKNMVLTIEPGLYFNEGMIRTWTQSEGYQHLYDLRMIEKYRPVGGVRIEDTIVITEDGYENLTSVPKQIDEIESLMAHSNYLK